MSKSWSVHVSSLFVMSALVLGACGDDEQVDTSKLDGGDRPLDASTPQNDASGDASVPHDAGARCELDQRYRFGQVGGNAPYTVSYELTTGGLFRRVRTPSARAGSDAGVESCESALPACGAAGVDAAELQAALSASAVQSAYATEPAVLGYDWRPVDGPIWELERADGKSILIGQPCEQHSNCTAIPPAVETLRALLARLVDEQTSQGSCSQP